MKFLEVLSGMFRNGATVPEPPTPERVSAPEYAENHMSNFQPERIIANWDAHKADLVHALTTRVVTDDELTEILKIGSSLFIRNMCVYRQEDVDKQFEHALRVQNEIRRMVKVPACQEERKEP